MRGPVRSTRPTTVATRVPSSPYTGTLKAVTSTRGRAFACRFLPVVCDGGRLGRDDIEGDDVTLRLFGVNGDAHEVWVEARDGTLAVPAVTINRGREVVLTFTAEQAGHYRLKCGNHAPTMEADILSI